MGAYADARTRSLTDPSGFWLDAASAVAWDTPPSIGLDDSAAPLYRWFSDGALNTSVNALDRHVEAGRGDRVAIYYDSPVTDSRRAITYTELRDDVARFAGVLAGLTWDVSRALVTQTLLGSARLLAEGEEHPGLLRAAVTSPGGTTAAGLAVLEQHGVRAALLAAVQAAAERSRVLGKPGD